MKTFIASIFVFGLLIIFHELGHFLVAKFFGVKVNEFSIGFGPKLLSFNKLETLYSIRAFPLGGYVKMAGEDEKTEDERGFSNKGVFERIHILLAGPLMNLILSVILIFIIAFFSGMATNILGDVIEESPADKAGLKKGDQIIFINEQKTDTWEKVVTLISQNPDEEIKVTVRRNDSETDYYLVPEKEEFHDEYRGVIGIKTKIDRFNLIESIKYGVERTIWIISMIFNSLILMIRGKVEADIVGPVGIIHLVGEAARFGLFELFSLASVISVNLAIFNLLPIPALDGSRILFIIIEFIRGKPVNPEKEAMIHFIGLALLMILMVFIAYKDILRFIY